MIFLLINGVQYYRYGSQAFDYTAHRVLGKPGDRMVLVVTEKAFFPFIKVTPPLTNDFLVV